MATGAEKTRISYYSLEQQSPLVIEGNLTADTFPEQTPEGQSGFRYFTGGMGALAQEITARRANTPAVENALRTMFQEVVAPSYDIIAEIATMQPDSGEGMRICIAPQITKPDIHVVSTDATIRVLQEAGFDIGWAGSVETHADVHCDDWAQDGVKGTLVEPVIVSTGKKGEIELLQSDVACGTAQPGRMLSEAQACQFGYFSSIIESLQAQGITAVDGYLIEPGMPLSAFHHALLQAADISLTTADRGHYDRRMLAHLLARPDLSHLTARIREQSLSNMYPQEGEKPNPRLKDVYAALHPHIRALMEDNNIDGAVALLAKYRLPARMYYSIFPILPAFSAVGGNVYLESYEVDQDFVTTVQRGFEMMKDGLSVVDAAAKPPAPKKIPGSPAGGIVVQEAWLSGVRQEPGRTLVSLNDYTSRVKTEITSSAIPAFIFDPTLRSQYRRYVSEYIQSAIGDRLPELQFADIHATALQATIQFMREIT